MASRTPKSVSTDSPSRSASGSLDRYASSIAFDIPDLLVESAWTEHAPFVFWLVEALQPGTFVELGTHSGYSYFSACQAVQRLKLSTRCYAVDTWQGDEHAGFYDEDVFEAVERHNSRRYASFSHLLRATFDEALDRFDAKSIDLLHIDGRHLYEDVKHDFESWLPKLSERAVVILHDTIVHARGFGVHRYWAELAERYPHFEFLHGHGLGVVSVGTVDPGLKHLFDASSDVASSTEIRKVYSSLGGRVAQEAQALLSMIAERDFQIADLQEALAHVRADSAESKRRSEDLNRIARERGLELARTEHALKLGEITENEAVELSESGLFDAEWYLSQNPDIAATGMTPALHYLHYGAVEGRDPSSTFDSLWYLSQNPDVAAAGMNPLVHYLRHGVHEGRSPSPAKSGQ